jgi:hypothetical protein
MTRRAASVPAPEEGSTTMGRTLRVWVAVSALSAMVLALAPATAMAAESTDGAAAAVAGVFYLLFIVIMSVVSMCSYAIFPLLGVATMALVVIALVDLIGRTDAEYPGALQGSPNPNEKMMWLLIILLAGIMGSILYVVLVMRKFPLSRLRGTVPPAPPGE